MAGNRCSTSDVVRKAYCWRLFRIVTRTTPVFILINIIFAFVWISLVGATQVPVDGLAGKIIVGYQGWFGCPKDFDSNQSWLHWFQNNVADARNLRVDLLPDMSEYPPESRCATHMTRRDGTTVNLYSNANAAAVDLHFRWMEKYGIDGAAVQRFVVVTTTSERTRWDLELLEEQRAAERHGRVFYVSYDVSGANPETVAGDIFNDWRHLVEDLKVTSSKRYLTDAGKPVLELWGFGVADRPGSPAVVLQLAHALKAGTPGIPPVTLVGGVAPEWRTLDGAAKSDPDWSDVYRSFDVISPWFTGRFNDSDTAVRYLRDRAGRDLAVTRKLGIDYMPVVFPGFSWSNLMRLDFGLQKPLNQIPRNCGKFYWSQIHELLAQHVTTLYVAMFDEVDEGTAIYKTIVEPKYLPSGTKLIERTLDGCTVSPDWYLRITGAARRYLSQRTVPPKSLYRAMNERP